MELLETMGLAIAIVGMAILAQWLKGRVIKGKKIVIECKDGYTLTYYSNQLPNYIPHIPVQDRKVLDPTVFNRYNCEGIETVSDVMIAKDEEQAKKLFKVKYPALQSNTVTVTEI